MSQQMFLGLMQTVVLYTRDLKWWSIFIIIIIAEDITWFSDLGPEDSWVGTNLNAFSLKTSFHGTKRHHENF